MYVDPVYFHIQEFITACPFDLETVKVKCLVQRYGPYLDDLMPDECLPSFRFEGGSSVSWMFDVLEPPSIVAVHLTKQTCPHPEHPLLYPVTLHLVFFLDGTGQILGWQSKFLLLGNSELRHMLFEMSRICAATSDLSSEPKSDVLMCTYGQDAEIRFEGVTHLPSKSRMEGFDLSCSWLVILAKSHGSVLQITWSFPSRQRFRCPMVEPEPGSSYVAMAMPLSREDFTLLFHVSGKDCGGSMSTVLLLGIITDGKFRTPLFARTLVYT